MTKKEAIMIIADQTNGNPGDIVEATFYLMNLDEARAKGTWIFHSSAELSQSQHNYPCKAYNECSVCHTYFSADSYARTPYCSQCGAEMSLKPQETPCS